MSNSLKQKKKDTTWSASFNSKHSQIFMSPPLFGTYKPDKPHINRIKSSQNHVQTRFRCLLQPVYTCIHLPSSAQYKNPKSIIRRRAGRNSRWFGNTNTRVKNGWRCTVAKRFPLGKQPELPRKGIN